MRPLFLFMRYYTEPSEEWTRYYGVTYRCNHPVYRTCTLYFENGKGLAVIQQRFNEKSRATFWGPIDPWLTDKMVDTWEPDAQINKNFLSMVQTHASNQLRTRGYLFLNEVYRMIGKYNNGQQIYNPQGQIVGWLYDPNNESLSNCVKFGLDKMQGDRSVVLHFNVDGPIIDKI